MAQLKTDLVIPQTSAAGTGRFRRRNVAPDSTAATIQMLLKALGQHDAYTRRHCEEVVALALAVSRNLDLSRQEAEAVAHVAQLHDIGKIGIPTQILRKTVPLDEGDWQLLREHPSIGANIVRLIPSVAHLAPAIRAEHEHWDGGGYPDGLLGEAIPLASRVVLACDSYHAMTSDRPYRRALPDAHACDEMRAGAGRQFDPAVVYALLTEVEA